MAVKSVMFYYLLLLIKYLNCTGEQFVTLDVQLNKGDFVLGETLTVSVNVTPTMLYSTDELSRICLELIVDGNLRYKSRESALDCAIDNEGQPCRTFTSVFVNETLSLMIEHQKFILAQGYQVLTLLHSNQLTTLPFKATISLPDLSLLSEYSYGRQYLIANLSYEFSNHHAEMHVTKFVEFNIEPARLHIIYNNESLSNRTIFEIDQFSFDPAKSSEFSIEVDTKHLPFPLHLMVSATSRNSTNSYLQATCIFWKNIQYQFHSSSTNVDGQDGVKLNTIIPNEEWTVKIPASVNEGGQSNVTLSFTVLSNISTCNVTFKIWMICGHYESPVMDINLIVIDKSNLSLDIMPLNGKDTVEAGDELKYELHILHHHSTKNMIIKYLKLDTFPGIDIIRNPQLMIDNNVLINNSVSNSNFKNGTGLALLLMANQRLSLQFELLIDNLIAVGNNYSIAVKADFLFVNQNISSIYCGIELCKNNSTGCKDKEHDPCSCPQGSASINCEHEECPVGWQYVQQSGLCYYYSPQSGKQRFLQAEGHCQQIRGRLPYVASFADFKALHLLQKKNNVTTGIWIEGVKESIFRSFHQSYDFDGDCLILSPDHPDLSVTKNCSNDSVYFCQELMESTYFGHKVSKSTSVELKVKPLIILNSSSLNLPNRVQIHEPITSTIRFYLPKGSLYNLATKFVLSSQDFPAIRVEFIRSDLIIPDGMHFNSTKAFSTLKSTSSNIKQLEVDIPIGTFIPPQFDHLLVLQSAVVNTTFLIAENARVILPSTVNVRMFVVYNYMQQQIDEGSFILVNPFLLLSRSVQFDPEKQHLDVLARIRHHENSTGTAYNVKYHDDISNFSLVNMANVDQKDCFLDKSRSSKLCFAKESLNDNESIELSYSLVADPHFVPSQALVYRNSGVQYSSLKPGQFLYHEYPGKKSSIEVSTCILRSTDIVVKEYKLQIKWIIFALLCAFITSLCICALAYYILFIRFDAPCWGRPDDQLKLINSHRSSLQSENKFNLPIKRRSPVPTIFQPLSRPSDLIYSSNSRSTSNLTNIIRVLSQEKSHMVACSMNGMDLEDVQLLEDNIEITNFQLFKLFVAQLTNDNSAEFLSAFSTIFDQCQQQAQKQWMHGTTCLEFITSNEMKEIVSSRIELRNSELTNDLRKCVASSFWHNLFQKFHQFLSEFISQTEYKDSTDIRMSLNGFKAELELTNANWCKELRKHLSHILYTRRFLARRKEMWKCVNCQIKKLILQKINTVYSEVSTKPMQKESRIIKTKFKLKREFERLEKQSVEEQLLKTKILENLCSLKRNELCENLFKNAKDFEIEVTSDSTIIAKTTNTMINFCADLLKLDNEHGSAYMDVLCSVTKKFALDILSLLSKTTSLPTRKTSDREIDFIRDEIHLLLDKDKIFREKYFEEFTSQSEVSVDQGSVSRLSSNQKLLLKQIHTSSAERADIENMPNGSYYNLTDWTICELIKFQTNTADTSPDDIEQVQSKTEKGLKQFKSSSHNVETYDQQISNKKNLLIHQQYTKVLQNIDCEYDDYCIQRLIHCLTQNVKKCFPNLMDTIVLILNDHKVKRMDLKRRLDRQMQQEEMKVEKEINRCTNDQQNCIDLQLSTILNQELVSSVDICNHEGVIAKYSELEDHKFVVRRHLEQEINEEHRILTLKMRRYLQQLDMELIKTLLRTGQINRENFLHLLRLLYPHKSKLDLKAFLNLLGSAFIETTSFFPLNAESLLEDKTTNNNYEFQDTHTEQAGKSNEPQNLSTVIQPQQVQRRILPPKLPPLINPRILNNTNNVKVLPSTEMNQEKRLSPIKKQNDIKLLSKPIVKNVFHS